MSEYNENSDRKTDLADGTSENRDAPVLVFNAVTEEEADVVRATLEAAGVPAFLQKASANPMLGAIDGVVDDAWINGVFVSAARAREAQDILGETPLTDEELQAAEEADPTTLEQAEERARRAK